MPTLPRPAIAWGPALASRAQLPYYPDEAAAYTAPKDGHAVATSEGTGRDCAWLVGLDSLVVITLRWIPSQTTGDVTGYDGASGVRALVGWLRAGELVRYWPDALDAGTHYDCYLVEPKDGPPELEIDGSKRIRLTLRVADGTRVTAY